VNRALLLLVTTLVFGSSAAFAREIPDDVYVLRDSDEAVEAVRQAAIERSVQSVSWFFRGFARSRLNKVATRCGAYRLVVSDPDFRVECNGDTVFAWTFGKTGTWTTETGDVVDVHLTEQPGGFELQFLTGNAGKTFTYVYGPDGDLRVSQKIHSPSLPVPVEYGLDYRVVTPGDTATASTGSLPSAN